MPRVQRNFAAYGGVRIRLRRPDEHVRSDDVEIFAVIARDELGTDGANRLACIRNFDRRAACRRIEIAQLQRIGDRRSEASSRHADSKL